MLSFVKDAVDKLVNGRPLTSVFFYYGPFDVSTIRQSDVLTSGIVGPWRNQSPTRPHVHNSKVSLVGLWEDPRRDAKPRSNDKLNGYTTRKT
jgi:hypothetical protein